MSDYRIANTGQDARVEGIGPLFKHDQQKRWKISLYFRSGRTKDSLSLSQAPILFRKSILDSSVAYTPGGWTQEFSISNTKDWKVCKIKDCPIQGFDRRRDSDQFCFAFMIGGGRRIYLPQFELARILFFRDAYLSRTALMSTALALEFDVSRNELQQSATINVLSSSGYALRHFNEPKSRGALAWILLDPEARRSYESIGQLQLQQGFNYKDFRAWDFRFAPPLLSAARFYVRGWFDKETNCLFVFNIDRIKNIRADIPEEVLFYHPRFKYSVRPDGEGGSYIPPRPQGDIEIEDDVDANVDTHTALISARMGSIEFSRPFRTIKQTTKIKHVPYGRPDPDQEVPGDRRVSTDEAVQEGELASADWTNASEEPDENLNYESKFDCFKKMVDVLTQQHGCQLLNMEIGKLPPLFKCRKHLLSNGDPRYLAVVVLRAQGKDVHLLEVDTSDGEKSLSTYLLRVIRPESWPQDLERVKTQLVKKSLGWPIQDFEGLCGAGGFQKIHHPKAPSNDKGVLTADSIAGWAARVMGWIVRL